MIVKEIARSVGIFFMDENWNTILVQRSLTHTHSNKGVYQPAANGGIKNEDGEDLLKTLVREIREELGEKFAETLNPSVFVLIDINISFYENTKAVNWIYLGDITEKQIGLIELSEESDKIIRVGLNNLDKIKTVFGYNDLNKIKTVKEVKKTGFNPDKDIVMFTGNFNTLKKIFELQPFLARTLEIRKTYAE